MSGEQDQADLGAYLGGTACQPSDAEPRPARQGGALFTDGIAKASCTAGRASFYQPHPIRSALSVVVVPGDPNGLGRDATTSPRNSEERLFHVLLEANGIWATSSVLRLSSSFDEMKQFAAYYPGVYGYSSMAPNLHPWFEGHAEFWKMCTSVVNLYDEEARRMKPAVKGDNVLDHARKPGQDFDMRQTDSAIEYIEARDGP